MTDAKKSKDDNFWSRLIWASTDEFVAPYGMDECIRHLEALATTYQQEEKSTWLIKLPHYELDRLQDNGGVFKFQTSGHMYRVFLKAQLRGQLFYKDEEETYVKTRLGFTLSSVISLIGILFFSFIIVFIISPPTSDMDFAFVFIMLLVMLGVVLLPNIIYGYSLKSELRYSLRKALIPPAAPRPTILPP